MTLRRPLHDSDTTGRIIDCAIAVSNALGSGFLERVYHNSLIVELSARRISHQTELDVPIHYRDSRVGIYRADLVVENKVVVEVKAVAALSSQHQAQLINYLRATQLKTGLLLNFGTPRLEIKRAVA